MSTLSTMSSLNQNIESILQKRRRDSDENDSQDDKIINGNIVKRQKTNAVGETIDLTETTETNKTNKTIDLTETVETSEKVKEKLGKDDTTEMKKIRKSRKIECFTPGCTNKIKNYDKAKTGKCDKCLEKMAKSCREPFCPNRIAYDNECEELCHECEAAPVCYSSQCTNNAAPGSEYCRTCLRSMPPTTKP